MLTSLLINILAKPFTFILLKHWLGDKSTALDFAKPAIDSFFSSVPGLLDKQRPVNRILSRLEDMWAKAVTDGVDQNVFTKTRVEIVSRILQEGYLKLLSEPERVAELGVDSQLMINEVSKCCGDDLRDLDKKDLEVFDYLNKSTLSHIFGLVNQLPNFQSVILKESLDRESEIVEKLNLVIETISLHLSEEKLNNNINSKYLSVIDSKFSHCKIFGLDVSFSEFELDLTYTNLRVRDIQRLDGESINLDVFSHLKDNNLTIVLGNPGAGKTTLLQWLTITQTRRLGKDDYEWLNNYVPFYIRLRGIDESPPALSEWPSLISSVLASPSNDKWVANLAEEGKLFVMLDGYDEVKEEKRRGVNSWIKDLIVAYPKIKIVMTSRQAAFKKTSFSKNKPCIIEIQPMNTGEIKCLAEKWFHAASRHYGSSRAIEIENAKRSILKRLLEDTYLRSIASTPLLCTMICVLALERNAHLPSSKKELYEAALDMLLERRDAERRIFIFDENITSKSDKQFILQKYAR